MRPQAARQRLPARSPAMDIASRTRVSSHSARTVPPAAKAQSASVVLTSLTQDVLMMRKNVSFLRRENARLQAEIASEAQRQTAVTEEEIKQQARYSHLVADSSRLSRELSELQRGLPEKAGPRASLEEGVGADAAALSVRKKTVHQLRESILRFQEQNRLLSDSLDSISWGNENLTETLETLRRTNDQLHSECESLALRLQALSSEYSDFQIAQPRSPSNGDFVDRFRALYRRTGLESDLAVPLIISRNVERLRSYFGELLAEVERSTINRTKLRAGTGVGGTRPSGLTPMGSRITTTKSLGRKSGRGMN